MQHFPFFPSLSSVLLSNFCPEVSSTTPPVFIIYFFNNSSKNKLKVKGFFAEVNLNGIPLLPAYFSASSSDTCSWVNKSCLFPAIPKTAVSPKTSLIVLYQYSNSSKDFLLVISYTKITIFESFINIFV